MAERQGFEPWMGYKPMPVFKTGAFDHSATSPSGAIGYPVRLLDASKTALTQAEKGNLSHPYNPVTP